MNQLDGAIDNEDIVTIATTNRLEVIEKALRNRPGRFDRVVEFTPMGEVCRRQLLEKLLAHANVTDGDLAYLIEATDEYTGAQLEELANTLYILAVGLENDVNAHRGSSSHAVEIGRALISTALAEVQVEHKTPVGFQVA